MGALLDTQRKNSDIGSQSGTDIHLNKEVENTKSNVEMRYVLIFFSRGGGEVLP